MPSDELDLGMTIKGFSAGQKLFGRYTLRQIIGRGGMGVVWLAVDEELERDVALKFLPELLLADRAALDDLKRDTKRSLELTHHNIVRIYNFAQDQNTACICMEYVDGPTLSARRVEQATRVFEVAEISPLVQQTCDALEYAHAHARIVHRDLKPTNLMVNARNEVKITDFGISRSLSDSVTMLTMNRGTAGTLPYMSPQQLNGDRVSPLDDIYSLGATVYELLTSKPPFYGGSIERQVHEKTPPPMLVRRRELEIESNVPIPLEWEETIGAALAKDPAKRPQSAKEFAEHLTQPHKFRPIVVTPPAIPVTSQPDARSWFRDNLMLVLGIAGGVVGVAIVIALAMLLMRDRNSSQTSAAPIAVASATPAITPSTPVPTPTTGRIIVNTIPAGASVYLDGTNQGRSPLVLEDISQGVHRLRVEADGYEDTALIAEVKPGATTDMGTLNLPAKPRPSSTPEPPAAYVPPTPPPSTPAPRPTYDYSAFVLQHLQKCINRDIAGIVADYADSVDYYENGTVGRAFIAQDRQKFAASWPALSVQMTSSVSNDDSNAPTVIVRFTYNFEARNGRKISRGSTDNTWTLLQTQDGLKISAEKQNVTNRSKR